MWPTNCYSSCPRCKQGIDVYYCGHDSEGNPTNGYALDRVYLYKDFIAWVLDTLGCSIYWWPKKSQCKMSWKGKDFILKYLPYDVSIDEIKKTLDKYRVLL